MRARRGNSLLPDGKMVLHTATLTVARGDSEVTIGPDGNVYITGDNPYIYRFNGETGAPLGTISVPGLAHSAGLTFAPNGDLYVTGHAEGGIFHLNGQTFNLVDEIDTSGISLAGSWTLLVVPEPSSGLPRMRRL